MGSYNTLDIRELISVQVVVAALVIADCVSFMPGNPHNGDDPILQV